MTEANWSVSRNHHHYRKGNVLLSVRRLRKTTRWQWSASAGLRSEDNVEAQGVVDDPQAGRRAAEAASERVAAAWAAMRDGVVRVQAGTARVTVDVFVDGAPRDAVQLYVADCRPANLINLQVRAIELASAPAQKLPAHVTGVQVHIGVQVNGTTHGTVKLAHNASEADAVTLARANPAVARHLVDMEIVRVEYKPGRVLNLQVTASARKDHA